jgi:hypothetical protein
VIRWLTPPANFRCASGAFSKASVQPIHRITQYDEGQTWPVSQSVEPEWSAYSDLAVTKAGTILCFYGRGEKASFAGGRLTVARCNLEWLTDGKDSPK